MCVCLSSCQLHINVCIGKIFIYIYVSRMKIIAVTIEINTVDLTVCNWDSIRYESGPFG